MSRVRSCDAGTWEGWAPSLDLGPSSPVPSGQWKSPACGVGASFGVDEHRTVAGVCVCNRLLSTECSTIKGPGKVWMFYTTQLC